MAITWNPQYPEDKVTKIGRLYAGFSFKDNGKRIALPVKYNSDPHARAVSLLNALESKTAYKIGSISAVIELNSDITRPDDPGAEPRGETFKFKAKRQGVMLEDDLSLHVPGFLSLDADEVQDTGEALAAILTEAGVVVVRFVGTAGQSRR